MVSDQRSPHAHVTPSAAVDTGGAAKAPGKDRIGYLFLLSINLVGSEWYGWLLTLINRSIYVLVMKLMPGLPASNSSTSTTTTPTRVPVIPTTRGGDHITILSPNTTIAAVPTGARGHMVSDHTMIISRQEMDYFLCCYLLLLGS